MKEVLEYLFGRLKAVRPVTVYAGDQLYAVQQDGTLGGPIRELAPQWTSPVFEVSTLTGLVSAALLRVDDYPEQVALHVVDYLTVELVSLRADPYGARHVYARATHKPETPFRFGAYCAPEEFLIAFRSSFYFNEEALKVQTVCSTVGAGEAVLVADDGVSQEITVKSGTVTRSSIALPADGVPLIPWRTFRDANPVESRFLLRMKAAKDSVPSIALFEVDARWKIDTAASIARYLSASLPGFNVIY